MNILWLFRQKEIDRLKKEVYEYRKEILKQNLILKYLKSIEAKLDKLLTDK